MPHRWLSPISLSHAHRPLISSVDIQQYFWRDRSNLECWVLCCHLALAKKKKKKKKLPSCFTLYLSVNLWLFLSPAAWDSFTGVWFPTPHTVKSQKKTSSPHLNVLECSSVFNDLLNVTAHFLRSNSAFPRRRLPHHADLFSVFPVGRTTSLPNHFLHLHRRLFSRGRSRSLWRSICLTVVFFLKTTINIVIHLKLDLSRCKGLKLVHRITVPEHLGSWWCTLELFKPELLGITNEITN